MSRLRRSACLKRWIIALWVGLFCALAGEPAPLQATTSDSLKFTDTTKRTIAIQMPVNRVVTINTASAIIMRALGVDMDRTVVGVTAYITQNPKFWPVLTGKPAFKFTHLNYEQLAELKPQLIILYKNSHRTTDENKLAALGIQWLYLDCNDPRTIDQDIQTLGRLFGKEKEAEELIAWRGRYARLINERVGPIPTEKKKRTYFYTFVQTNLDKRIYSTKNQRSSCHPLVQDAGGINIAGTLPQESLQVSAEWLMEQNPDAIVGGVIAKTVCGYNANENATVFNLKAMHGQLTKDPVLKETDAVKDSRVLLIAQDLKEGPATVVGTLYIAKFLYPERFADIDPDAVLREYHEKWCGLAHRGVYVYPPYPETPVEEKAKTPVPSVSIVDSAGRRVTIPQPLKRIAGLQSSGCREFSLLQIEDRVVGVTEYLQGDPGMLPRLVGKPNIGSVYTPNYEIIAQMNPQVVFMGTAAVNLQPAIDKLTPMGIQVVAMDFQPIRGDDAYAREAHYDEELLLLGRMTGKEARAKAFVKWKTDLLEMIRRRTAGTRKKQVLGLNSVSKLLGGNTFTIWAGKRIIELAGGIDPSAGLSVQEVSGEWVLQQNPEVIIVSSYWLTEGLGYGATDAMGAADTHAKVSRHAIICRTRAAQSGNVFLFSYYGVASGGQTALGALYLAKRLYPDRFADVQPETFHKDYFEKWFDVDYRGVWFYP